MLIYVGAVMVFMVYVIMLLDVRDATLRPLLEAARPGRRGLVVLLGALVAGVWQQLPHAAGEPARPFGVSALLGRVPQRILAACSS